MRCWQLMFSCLKVRWKRLTPPLEHNPGLEVCRGCAGNVKMTQPIAFTTAMLAWSVLSFPKGLGGSKTDTLQQVQVCDKESIINQPGEQLVYTPLASSNRFL